MSAPLPTGYTPPHSRDRDQVMADGTAQNLIAQIVDLHDQLHAKLEHDVDVAALGASEPASGFVTGSSDHDRMDARSAAIKQAEKEQARQLKNARQELRRVVEYYETRLGLRSLPRPRIESIDYQHGTHDLHPRRTRS